MIYEKILIIRPDRIGDFVIFSAVLKYYRELFKDYEIHLLVIPLVKSLAENCPYVDRIITFDIEKFSSEQIRKLKENFYDKIIYPVYSRCEDRDKVAILARGKEKIVFDGDASNDLQNLRFKYNKFFTAIIQSEPHPKKEIERNAEFIRELGYKGELNLEPEIWCNKEDEIRFQQFKDEYKLKEKDYIVLSSGARYPIRLWKIENWVSLVSRLSKMYSGQMIFCGIDKDEIVIKGIIKKIDFNRRIINLVNKTDLRLLTKIVENASLFIGMESATIHIAAALGTPNICLMGGGHFGRFYPYGDLEKNRIVYYEMDCFGCDWRCKFQHNDILSKIKRKLPFREDQNLDLGKCVKNIKVENVLEEVKFLLKKSSDESG